MRDAKRKADEMADPEEGSWQEYLAEVLASAKTHGSHGIATLGSYAPQLYGAYQTWKRFRSSTSPDYVSDPAPLHLYNGNMG